MEISEKQIEDLIVDNIKSNDLDALYDRGLDCIKKYDKFFRQFDLGDYGRLDLAGVKYNHINQGSSKKSLDIAVIEIKKGEVNYNSLIQAVRYCKGIEHVLKEFNLVAEFEIILIGSSVCKSDFVYLADYMPALNIYTINLDLKLGINFFNHFGYEITNPKKVLISEVTIADMKSYLTSQVRNNTNEDQPF